jgi:predicted adenine nucleotide alpha hydrolase (AANH) superfamily ATPase
MSKFPKLLLHVCCGPCATVPLRHLREAGRPFATFYSNANIHPAEEYDRRLATYRKLAAPLGVEVVADVYEPKLWDEAIGNRAGIYPLVEGDAAYDENRARRQERCRACYAFRFERLAAEASARGCEQVATTLSISPYQFTDIMAHELSRAARQRGLASAFVDYREHFAESSQTARKLGLYRQNYCGCRYSKAEAELERAARKAARVTKAKRAAGTKEVAGPAVLRATTRGRAACAHPPQQPRRDDLE